MVQTAHLHRIQLQTPHNEAIHDIDFVLAIFYITFSAIFVNPSYNQNRVSNLTHQSHSKLHLIVSSSLLPSAFALWASLCYQADTWPCSIVQRRWQPGWQTRQPLPPTPRFHLLETYITMNQRSRLGEWRLSLRCDLELQTSRTWYLIWLGSQVNNWLDSCGVNINLDSTTNAWSSSLELYSLK